MTTGGTAQTQWNPVNEAMGENGSRRLDDAFEARKDAPLDTHGAASAMGGIGEVGIEEGEEIAAKALNEEAQDAEGDDLDALLAGLDVDGGENITEGAEAQQLGLSCEYAPLLGQFAGEGKITQEQAVSLTEKGINADNFHEVIQECDLTIKQEEQLIASLEYIGSDATIIKSEGEIQSEFGDLFNDFKDPDLATINPAALTAYREVTAHYIPHGKDHEEQSTHLDLAIQMAAGHIANTGVLDLNTSNRTTFNTAMDNILNQDTPLAKKFAALETVTEVVNADQAQKGGKNKLSRDFRDRQALKQKNALQDKAFQTTQMEAVTDQKDKGGHPITDEEIKDTDTPSGGDVFAASKGEVVSTRSGKSTETA